jgi:uncharacterized protein (DUF1800 family)
MDRPLIHAVRRFGFGSSVTADAPPADIQQWFRAQLDVPDPVLAQPGPTILRAALAQRNWEALIKAGAASAPGLSEVYQSDMTAILQQAITSDLPVRERLAWFWGNHFTVSGRAGGWALGLLGCYLHDAIRPHVTGRFVDMLKAVMVHPAMLWYLDNWLSVGPNSPDGLARHQGINENLARECLELHTLGAGSGYTQADVTSFAAILTGRSIEMGGDTPGYVYKANAHEPGPKTFMGHTVPEGFAGSEAVLEFIADHPATHRHLATQLVRHYVADTPPERCVERVAAVLKDTGGDLKQAMLAIFDLAETWQPLTKFKAPAEYCASVIRALSLPPEGGFHLLAATEDLGQHFGDAILPNGWPDTAADWISGEGILKRADWAMTQASRPGAPPAQQVLAATVGDVCSDATRAAVARCPNQAEALATLFVSPEFLRR